MTTVVNNIEFLGAEQHVQCAIKNLINKDMVVDFTQVAGYFPTCRVDRMAPQELEKWAYINWGAPTNSLETINIEADSNGIINERISFTTLHTTPSVVIKKLSELHPDVTIEVQFASEDIGAYCGEHHFKDGECIHKQENNYQELNQDEQNKWNRFALETIFGEMDDEAMEMNQFGFNNDGSPIK